MAARPRIQHVSIPRPFGPDSAAQARAFYGDVLGLPEALVPTTLRHLDLVWFQLGDTELHVFAQDSAAESPGSHFCMEVDDVDTMRQQLARAGHPTTETTPVHNRPRFFCNDPFNNSIEITTIMGHHSDGLVEQ